MSGQQPVPTPDPYYNRDNFPHVVVAGHQGGGWDLCADLQRKWVASVPLREGLQASLHGSYEYARMTARFAGAEWLGGEK